MHSWLGDIRVAARSLRDRPLFTAIVVASLAVGLGAVTTTFAVVNSLLLRSVPGLAEPDRVVEIGRTTGGRGFDTFSWPEYEAMRTNAAPLEHVAGWTSMPLSLSTGAEGERVFSLLISQAYFDAMGVTPALGRFFLPEEDMPGAGSVAVLSYEFWRQRFGSDPAILGQPIELNRRRFTIVGVAPAEFRGHTPLLGPDVYVPLGMIAVASPGFDLGAMQDPRSSWFFVVGRLAPGASIAQADAAVKAVIAGLAPAVDDRRNERSGRVVRLGPVPGAGRAAVTAFLALILGTAVVVMVIACANVAGMLLARASGRDREMGIRLALGSGRLRLIRHLLTEVLVLFMIGGLAAIAVAFGATRILESVRLPIPVPIRADFTPDGIVVGAGLALALLTGLVFGLAPALQANGAKPMLALRKESVRPDSRVGRARSVFLAAQLALSVMLLVSAGLFLRSLQRASGMHTGFDATEVSTLMVDLSIDGYDEERGRTFFSDLLGRLRSLPGVAQAAFAADLPLDLGAMGMPVITESGPASGGGGMGSDFNIVSDGYFETLRIAFLAGRTFDSGDVREAEPVAVVSRTLAERAWPNESALGKRIRFAEEPEAWRTVIGVVDNVKNQMLSEQTAPMYYVPLAQTYSPAVNVVVRGGNGPDPAGSLAAAIRELDPQLSLTATQRLEAVTAVGILPQRIGASATGVLGLIALLLSALGVYGIIAFLVAQRKFEMAVRAALGARNTDIVRLVLGGAFRMAIPGLVIGWVAAYGLGHLMRGFILGVAAADPITFVAMPAVLVLAVGLAGLVPALRAAAIPPSTALRAD